MHGDDSRSCVKSDILVQNSVDWNEEYQKQQS